MIGIVICDAEGCGYPARYRMDALDVTFDTSHEACTAQVCGVHRLALDTGATVTIRDGRILERPDAEGIRAERELERAATTLGRQRAQERKAYESIGEDVACGRRPSPEMIRQAKQLRAARLYAEDAYHAAIRWSQSVHGVSRQGEARLG